jgi:hypothetical protein
MRPPKESVKRSIVRHAHGSHATNSIAALMT